MMKMYKSKGELVITNKVIITIIRKTETLEKTLDSLP